MVAVANQMAARGTIAGIPPNCNCGRRPSVAKERRRLLSRLAKGTRCSHRPASALAHGCIRQAGEDCRSAPSNGSNERQLGFHHRFWRRAGEWQGLSRLDGQYRPAVLHRRSRIRRALSRLQGFSRSDDSLYRGLGIYRSDS